MGSIQYRLRIPARRGYPELVTADTAFTRVPKGLPGRIRLLSANRRGRPGNAASWGPQVSPDGTKVAFTSLASDLTRRGTRDRHPDVFVRDLRTETTRLVSRNAAGEPANGASGLPQWLPDSERLLFASEGTNLGGPPRAGGLWVKDLGSGAIRHVGWTGLAWNDRMLPAAPDPYADDPPASPLLLSPDGATVLTQVDPSRVPGFCVPNPNDEPVVGRCTKAALGSLSVRDGTIRVLRGGKYFDSASGVVQEIAEALELVAGQHAVLDESRVDLVSRGQAPSWRREACRTDRTDPSRDLRRRRSLHAVCEYVAVAAAFRIRGLPPAG